MYGLEPGQYARKYSFWALEYVFRRKDYSEFCQQFYIFQRNMLKKYLASNPDADVSLNNLQDYAATHDIIVTKQDSKSICSTLTEEYRFFCTYGYPAVCYFVKSNNILESFLDQKNLSSYDYRGRVGAVLFNVDLNDNKTHPVKFDEYTNGMVLDIRIDLSKPMNIILREVESVVDSAKLYDSGSTKDFLGEEFSLSYYELLADSEASFRSGYNPRSDLSRAIGLWLWDNIKKNGGKYDSVIRAIEEFESMPNFDDFGLGSTPDYYHWLRRTEACIEAAEVLTFDKKNSESKKRKRPSGTRKRKLVPGTKTAK